MTRGMWTSLLAVAAVLVFGTSYLAVAVARVDPFAEHTTVTMTLGHAAGLATGSPVLLRGIEIGEVERIEQVGAGVDVTMLLDADRDVPVASAVRVESLSALGEPYVDFRPSSAEGPYLRDGDRIDTRAVWEPISLPRASRAVARLLSAVDPEVLASLTATFDVAFADVGAVTPRLRRSGELLSATLLARMPAVRQLMVDLQDIGADMAWFEPATVESAPLWTLFAQRFSEIVDSLAGISRVGDTPAMYLEGDGLVPVIGRITDWLEREGPELARLAPVVAPLAEGPSAAPLDVSALITQALAAVGPEGTLRLDITVK